MQFRSPGEQVPPSHWAEESPEPMIFSRYLTKQHFVTGWGTTFGELAQSTTFFSRFSFASVFWLSKMENVVGQKESETTWICQRLTVRAGRSTKNKRFSTDVSNYGDLTTDLFTSLANSARRASARPTGSIWPAIDGSRTDKWLLGNSTQVLQPTPSLRKLRYQFKRIRPIISTTDKHFSLNSEDDFRSGCRNVTRKQQLRFQALSPFLPCSWEKDTGCGWSRAHRARVDE